MTERPYHFECHFRMIVGSVAHQQGRCSCFGGTKHEPPGVTLRQSAVAAYRYWKVTNDGGSQNKADGAKFN
jgi:hypothetical protein